MTLSGNVGIRFNLAETTGSSTTGTFMQTHEINTTVGDMTIETSDVAVSMYGMVGAQTYELKLDNLVNLSGDDIDVQVIRNQAVDINNVKMVSIYNQATTAENNLIIIPGAQSSFLEASEQITLKPQQGVGLAYGNPETVGASSSCMYIYASAGSVPHSIYVFGN